MVIKNAVFVTSAASEKQFIKSDKPIIAVAGKSNVGKSSFINTIAGQKKLARTSDTPGRTRLIISSRRPSRLRLCEGFKGRKRALGAGYGKVFCR